MGTTPLGREGVSRAAHAITRLAASAWMAGVSALLVLGLLTVGLVAGFPEWWQVVVFATSALVTLLMLFVIQHTTDRQTHAILLKLDELIQATGGAHDDVIAVEDRNLQEQEALHRRVRQHRL